MVRSSFRMLIPYSTCLTDELVESEYRRGDALLSIDETITSPLATHRSSPRPIPSTLSFPSIPSPLLATYTSNNHEAQDANEECDQAVQS